MPTSTAKEILKTVKQGFKQVDQKLTQLDRKVSKLDGKVSKLDGKVSKLDGKVSKLDSTLSSVVLEVTAQGRKLDTLVTRVEFNEFKDQTLTHFDGLAKQIEDLQEEQIFLKA